MNFLSYDLVSFLSSGPLLPGENPDGLERKREREKKKSIVDPLYGHLVPKYER